MTIEALPFRLLIPKKVALPMIASNVLLAVKTQAARLN